MLGTVNYIFTILSEVKLALRTAKYIFMIKINI